MGRFPNTVGTVARGPEDWRDLKPPPSLIGQRCRGAEPRRGFQLGRARALRDRDTILASAGRGRSGAA
jgi:hypothetical protein